ncbi:MAG TPA: glycosyltransferase family 2 protein, partial [Armatimonadota bacterium]|nr:glycosyltransferase family 2 protein [Armatimonadota bacterium]
IGAWRREVVLQAGGFEANTLAEDTDLTFKVRLLGYHTICDNRALAYTEAPDGFSALARQRFRWSFGILQALWKHRRQLLKPEYGAFSCVVMPSMWIYNFALQVLAPFVDLSVMYLLFTGDWSVVCYYLAAFFVLDLVASYLALWLDGEDKKLLLWLFWQRFVYREFMYYIIVKSLLHALRGSRVGWGKLQRKATVSMPDQL